MNDARRAMTASRTEKATFKSFKRYAPASTAPSSKAHRETFHRAFPLRGLFTTCCSHWVRVNQAADAKRRQRKRILPLEHFNDFFFIDFCED